MISNKRFQGVKSVGANSAFLLSTQFTSILIRLVYLFVLARSVMPIQYGALTYASSWYLALLPFTYLGTDVVLGREIARRRDAAPALLGTTLGLRLVVTPLVVAASFLLAALVEQDEFVRSLVVLFCLSLFGRSLWMWSAGVFIAFEQSRFVLRFEVSSRLLEVAALLLMLWFFGPDLRGIAIIHVASWTLQGAVAVLEVWRRYGVKLKRPSANWLAVIGDGAPGAAFAIAMAAFSQLPIMMFRHTDGMSNSLGHFALAYQILTYLIAIPYVICNASLPVLSRSADRKDGKDRNALLAMLAIIIVCGAIVALTAPPAIELLMGWLFGPDYGPAIVVLAGGLWLLIPASLALLVQHMLFSNEFRSPAITLAPMIGVVFMAVLFPPLIHAFGDSGAMWSIAIGFFVWFVWASIMLTRSGFFRPLN